LLVIRALFLLNADFALAILDLISQVHFEIELENYVLGWALYFADNH
jgi:hypothetical protein